MKQVEDVVALELTFTRRHALKPLMIDFIVVGTSAVLKPSAVRSATTASAGFLERAAVGACQRISDC